MNISCRHHISVSVTHHSNSNVIIVFSECLEFCLPPNPQTALHPRDPPELACPWRSLAPKDVYRYIVSTIEASCSTICLSVRDCPQVAYTQAFNETNSEDVELITCCERTGWRKHRLTHFRMTQTAAIRKLLYVHRRTLVSWSLATPSHLSFDEESTSHWIQLPVVVIVNIEGTFYSGAPAGFKNVDAQPVVSVASFREMIRNIDNYFCIGWFWTVRKGSITIICVIL